MSGTRKQLKNNREMLQRLNDVVTSLASAFRGGESSINIMDLIHLLRRYHERPVTHLETSTSLSGKFSHIQNNLIEAIIMVMLGDIQR